MSIPSAKATLSQNITDYVLNFVDSRMPMPVSWEEIEEEVYSLLDEYKVEFRLVIHSYPSNKKQFEE